MKNLNNIHKIILNIFSFAIIALLTLSSNVAYADEIKNLESGIYEINNEVYHDSEVGISMARSYTADTMKLEYTKETMAYTVTFTGTDYMQDYRILVNDEPVDFEVVDENKENTSISLKFNVTDMKDKISAKIFVSAMDRDVEFEVKPLVETLNLVESIEEPEEEVSAQETSKNENEDIQKSSEKSSILPVAIGAVVVIIAVIAFKVIKKK